MSSSKERVAAREPRRERGRRRVATLLEAAVSLFAEKGYDAVTMTEVAARAGAPIGSLYQFFPGKEALADAVLDRFGERLDGALGAIEARAATLAIPDLVEALLGLFDGLDEERAAVSALIESRREATERALGVKLGLRRHLARVLMARMPGVAPERAERMATAVIPLMKAAVAQGIERDPAIRAVVLDELKAMLTLYFRDRMDRPAGEDAAMR